MSVDTLRLSHELKEIQERTRHGRQQLIPFSREELLAKLKAFEERRDTLTFAPEPPTVCSECQDTHVRVFTDEAGIRRGAPCSCTSRPVVAQSIFECPVNLLAARLANFTVCLETAHAVQAAREFVADGRDHLYFNGGPGRGKTRLAMSAARERADRGDAGAFISVPWLVALSQRGIDDVNKRAEAANLEDRALYTPVVILDDVGAGNKGTDFPRDILTRILERRSSRQLRTIITSNFDLPQLAHHYNDERIVSRIAGMVGETYELGGPDRRLAPRVTARRDSMRIVERNSGEV